MQLSYPNCFVRRILNPLIRLQTIIIIYIKQSSELKSVSFNMIFKHMLQLEATRSVWYSITPTIKSSHNYFLMNSTMAFIIYTIWLIITAICRTKQLGAFTKIVFDMMYAHLKNEHCNKHWKIIETNNNSNNKNNKSIMKPNERQVHKSTAAVNE